MTGEEPRRLKCGVGGSLTSLYCLKMLHVGMGGLHVFY